MPAGSNPGTLIGTSVNTNFDTENSIFRTAVYREAGGTLDFYFQLTNNGSPGATFTRLSNSLFTAFATSVGYRVDGAAVSGPGFTNGTVQPSSADHSANASTVGFNFAAAILPATSSFVFIISTNAVSFTTSNSYTLVGTGPISFLADGFETDGAAAGPPVTYNNLFGFIPAAAPLVTAPDNGNTALLLIAGVLALFATRRVLRCAR